jgi:hypothetical protein
MRMSVQVPRSMMGAIPDAHGIVTDHDGLAMYGDFRKVAEPRELLGQLANLFVVIARHRKDLPAANLLAVLFLCPSRTTMFAIAREMTRRNITDDELMREMLERWTCWNEVSRPSNDPFCGFSNCGKSLFYFAP